MPVGCVFLFNFCNHGRLENAELPDRIREFADQILVKISPRLVRVRFDLVEFNMKDRLGKGRFLRLVRLYLLLGFWLWLRLRLRLHGHNNGRLLCLRR